jgi:hypothetical protein
MLRTGSTVPVFDPMPVRISSTISGLTGVGLLADLCPGQNAGKRVHLCPRRGSIQMGTAATSGNLVGSITVERSGPLGAVDVGGSPG